MIENLPPPNWSPTGNSGCWRWDEIGEKEHNGTHRPCWRWDDDDDDELPVEAGEERWGEKNWLTKLQNFIKIKK
jgi:hypothetical protein